MAFRLLEFPSVSAVCESPYRGRSVDSAGEVHGLVGENGAGKSTLIRILSGGLKPDEGSVQLDGISRSYSSPADSRKDGVVTIFQELAIVPELTVAENIVLGAEPSFDRFGLTLSRHRANLIAGKRPSKIAWRCNRPPTPRRNPVCCRTPTRRDRSSDRAGRAILHHGRANRLAFSTRIQRASGRRAQLRSEGKAILFVSHHLDEVLQISDRVTVLRGGRAVTTLPAKAATSEQLIELMIGRPMETLYPPRLPCSGPPVLRVRNLSRPPSFEDISFDLHRGEILGFAGLVGAGRTEIMRAIFGLEPPYRGTIELDGKAVAFRSPRQAVRAGLAFVSEDRKGDGLVAQLSGRGKPRPDCGSRRRIRRRGSTREHSCTFGKDTTAASHPRVAGPACRGLSGGNQQKVVIGKWLLGHPHIMIFDEPTRGIDVGAKAEVYRTIQKASQDGASILLVSSELSELIHVAHRILVISGGRITAEMSSDDFDEKEILKAAFAAHLSSAATEAELQA